MSTTLDLGPLLKRLRKVPRDAMRIMQTAVDVDAKGFVVDVIGVTPPFYLPKTDPESLRTSKPPSRAKLGKEAKDRGEIAITADLLGLKAGRSKERRTAGVFVIMADDLLERNARIAKDGTTVRLFVKKDGTVYGCDKQFYRPKATVQEMYAYHQSMRSKKTGRVFTRGGATRDVGRWRFINQMVVSRTAYLRYERYIHKRVGMLAAGWKPAASAMGVRLPRWIDRHTGQGSVNIRRGPMNYSVIISNSSKYGKDADLKRRVVWALSSEKRKKRIAHRINGEIRAVLRAQRFATA